MVAKCVNQIIQNKCIEFSCNQNQQSLLEFYRAMSEKIDIVCCTYFHAIYNIYDTDKLFDNTHSSNFHLYSTAGKTLSKNTIQDTGVQMYQQYYQEKLCSKINLLWFYFMYFSSQIDTKSLLESEYVFQGRIYQHYQGSAYHFNYQNPQKHA